MSVDIEPLELSFKRPFTVEVSQTLTIKNPNSTPLAFKVKTTAPKQYCVRPNAGRIEPGSSFDVSVLLQAMKADPPLDAKCRDKFLVQSATITPDKEFDNIASVLENTEKSQIQDRKIRVNWLAAGSDEEKNGVTRSNNVIATPNKQSLVNGASETPDTSRKYSSPKSSAPSSNPPPYSPDVGKASKDSKDAKEDEEVPEAPKSTMAQAATAVSTTAQVTYEELKAKLAEAQAQIASLKDSSGLRQRNVKSNEEGERAPVARTAQAVRQAVEGVPVQVVALLCLLSFLLAYFFF